MEIFILHQIYAGYENIVKEENFIKNGNFHFAPNLCGIQKHCQGKILFILKRSTNLLMI